VAKSKVAKKSPTNLAKNGSAKVANLYGPVNLAKHFLFAEKLAKKYN